MKNGSRSKKQYSHLNRIQSLISVRRPSDENFIENIDIVKNVNTGRLEDITNSNPFIGENTIQKIDREQPATKSIAETTGVNGRRIFTLSRPVGSIGGAFGLKSATTVSRITPTETFTTTHPVLEEITKAFRVYCPDNKNTNSQVICIQLCKDQEGSRFVQNKLDEWTLEEIGVFFNQISTHLRELSTNLFGNYVIQKLFRFLTPEQFVIVRNRFEDHVSELSFNMFGCRVIQAYLDTKYEADFIVDDISENLKEYIPSQFGNHVVQKCLEHKYAADKIMQIIIIDAKSYATEKFGCRIIQSILSNLPETTTRPLGFVLLAHAHDLITDQYGNYVVQLLIQTPEYKKTIQDLVITYCREFAMCKYSSNVVEKYVNTADSNVIEQFFQKFNEPDEKDIPFFITMLKDGCANYVVQTLFTNSKPEQKKIIGELMVKYADELRDVPYFKSLQSKFSI